MSSWLTLLTALACVAAVSPARAQIDTEAPAIAHEEVRSGRIGESIVVAATLSDASGIFDPAVLYRVGGEGEFLRVPLQPVPADESAGDGRYRAVIPGDVVSADIEYFIEAFDQRGNGPARYADADLPVTVRVLKTAEPLPDPAQPAAGAVVEEGEGGGGAVWVIAGVVGAGALLAAAAAAGVGAFVLLSPPALPAQVDVVIAAPTPVAAGLAP